MALDKLVDSSQLDTDLTSVANAIRTKGGTSAQLAFPSGFVSAINAISGGGGGGGTTIDTAGDYTVNAGSTITMGSGLTGLLSAKPAKTLTNSWNFKTGLTDSVGGLTVTLSNGASRDSNGLKIDGGTQYASIPIKFSANKTYEWDIASISKGFSSGHGRVFTISSSDGLLYNSSGYWAMYLDGTWMARGGNDVSLLNGITLRMTTELTYTQLYNGTSTVKIIPKLYRDGTLWYVPKLGDPAQTANMTIGSSSTSFYNMVVTGFRVYNGI